MFSDVYLGESAVLAPFFALYYIIHVSNQHAFGRAFSLPKIITNIYMYENVSQSVTNLCQKNVVNSRGLANMGKTDIF